MSGTKIHSVSMGDESGPRPVAIVHTGGGPAPSDEWRFRLVAEEKDETVGELPDGIDVGAVPIEGSASAPIRVKPVDDLPPAVIGELLRRDIDAVLINVTSTWAEWNGRPEFSEAEIDVTDAYVEGDQ